MNKRFTYLFSFLLSLIGFTSCSEDVIESVDTINEEEEHPFDRIEFDYNIEDDLLFGKVILNIDLASLSEGDYILNTKERVDFYTYGTNTIELAVKDYDRYQTLTAKASDGYKGERIVFPAYAVGRESGDVRNVIIVAENTLQNNEEDLNEISPLFPTYGNFLGKGTLCYEKLGNTTRDILLFNRLPLRDGNLFTSSNINKTSVDEIHDTSFESVTKSWAFNVGVSGAAKGFSGGLSFGMHDMSKRSKDYEYYMSYLKVERTEMKLHTDELRKMSTRDNKSAQTLIGYFATSFSEDVMEKSTLYFNAENFYSKWGTDMIQQGTLGGECKFVFSREENTYQHTIGTDIKAYVEHKKEVEPKSNMGQWYNIFMQQSNQPDVKVSFDFSWQKEEYQKASHSELKIEALGGNSSTDPEKWLSAFQEDDEYSKWSIVSYLTAKDQKSSDSWYLYRMEDIASDLVNAVEKVFSQTNNMSYQDEKILENAKRNIWALTKGRLGYINQYKVTEADKTPLVIADFKMVRADKHRASGQPKPFTAPNPANTSQYLTYYPVICNPNLDITSGKNKMRGKPLDTADGLFTAGSHLYKSHYWYYAMAHASEDCPGITAIEFLTEKEAHKNSKYRDYHKHGDGAQKGSGLAVSDRYCYVKYYDSKEQNPGKRITAIAFWDAKKKYKNRPTTDHIFGSTGGTAWLPEYKGSDRQKYFENFWSQCSYTTTSNQFYQYGGAIPHPFKLIYTTDALPVKDLKELPKVEYPTW